jgi:hypothetical protein
METFDLMLLCTMGALILGSLPFNCKDDDDEN